MSHLQQEKKIMNKKITLNKLKKITKKIKPIYYFYLYVGLFHILNIAKGWSFLKKFNLEKKI